MNKKLTSSLLIFLFIFSISATAQNKQPLVPTSSTAQVNQSVGSSNYWSDVNEGTIPNVGTRYITPVAYRTNHLDLNRLKTDLSNTQILDYTQLKNATYTIELPMPEGGYETFAIAETPIMEKPLYDLFPEIKTYSGFSVGQKGWYLKLDITTQGFHAMILNPDKGTIFIDPYSFGGGDIEHYIVYYRKDYASSVTKTFTCDVQGNSTQFKSSKSFKKFGTCELRTYRLALAATGEYTAFHGGTAANAQSAQVTTMNRVNGVYERDMAITMVIIGNNNLLIYTNGGSDPYSNGNAGAMLGENQTNVNNVIGSGNYDIGHVFGTNSGGVAGLGVVCSNNNKARGVTGSGSPIGDTFDIDYVAHEMGHQFAGNHCFNNSCGGNRNNATAMEPGSASTIMGYAGICAPDVQNYSDDYFHGVNLEEISNFITGGGHTCPVVTPLSNDAPTITSTNGNVTIPGSTPFALTATAVDTNVADVLSYCWEQMDNDISTQAPVSTSTDGPNFRSLNPSISPTRYFPNLTDLVAGGPFTWEVLPSVSRSMDFRVSVRDNSVGGSCSDHEDITLTVDASTGPFVVTYPSISGISWGGGSSQTVTWNVAGTDGGGVNCANVDIFLSTDGGQTWSTVLASGVANDGSELIIVPNTPSTTALIMVMCSNGTFFDISDNVFEITTFAPVPPVANFQADVTTTCTGEVQFTDLSTNVPTIWSWDFGDGGTSTQQNPFYIYASAGTYSVQLTVTNVYGSDSVIFTSYIIVTKPAAPSTTGASLCGPGSVTLSASGTNTLNWYDDSVGTNLLTTGTTFTTPVLSTTTNYFVEEEIPAPIQNVGPVDNTIGSGNDHSNTAYYLIFDCFSPFTLLSVKVYADGPGVRTIEYRNSSGTVLQDTSVNLPDGESRVTLNFDITPGTNYQLATSGQSDMYRNNGGVNFPYTLPGIVSITGNNIPDPDYYYYYYDWEIREPGCTSEPALVTATINDEPTVNISLDNGISCTGACDGILSAAITGGTPSYTYTWSNAQTSSSATSLCSGNHVVTVTDANGCTETDNLFLTDPPGGSMNITATGTDATCGNADGTATATPTSGTSPYTYLWSDPGNQTNATATGLATGTYYVTVTDDNGCTGIDSVSIFNVVPTLSSTFIDVSCNGGSDGTATVTPSGGNAPYTYLWSGTGSQTNATATGLSAGTFYITVTDNAGCLQADTVTISEPAAISMSLSATDATCSGNDGTATVTAGGGTGTLTYTWNDANSQTNTVATGLSGGTYSVTIIDGNSCSVIDSITVGEPIPINIVLTPDSVNCNGGTDGSITANATGGNGAYTYLWNDPNGQTNSIATGLGMGTYTVTVTDNDGCFAISSGNVPEPTLLSVTVNAGTVSCNGGNDGTATAMPSGGAGSYTYSWSTTPAQTSSTAIGLSGGISYSVLVTDGNSCNVTSSVTLTDPAAIVLSSSTTDASCGNADGSASISIVSGGVSPFTYSWSNGASSSTANGLMAGAYTVTVTDVNNCSETGTATVSDAGAPTISISGSDVSCNGGNDGSASVTASGGTPPFTYLWSTGAASSSISAITTGTYSVDISDASGCTASTSIVINEPQAISLGITAMDASCGLSDGTATVTSSGGTGAYTYLWNNGQTASSAVNLAPGTYYVTVTDVNNCSANSSVSVNQANGPTLSVTTTGSSCGNSDGSAAASATGGNGTYLFTWSNGQAGTSITGLSSGAYQVTVTDGNNCKDSTSFTILDVGGPIITISFTNVSCNSTSDGTVAVTAIGGTQPYSYSWDDPGNSTTATVTNLAAGTYNVTLADAQGCIAIGTASIDDPGILTTTITGIDDNCNGGCNGLATISVAGGTGTYTYTWNDPANQTNAIATGLCAGTYMVNINDSQGCQASEFITISQPPSLSLSINVTNGICGNPNSLISATVSGGTTPYAYSWSADSNQTGAFISGISSGNYTLIASDNNSCAVTDTFTVNNGLGLDLSFEVQDETCTNTGDGSIDLTANGGTPPFNFVWSNGSGNEDVEGLSAGLYHVFVVDINNCFGSDSITIESESTDCFNIPSGFTPNGDGTNDGWNIKGLEGFPEVTVEVFNRWGSVVFNSDGYPEEWDGTYNGKELPAAVYYYIITIDEKTSYSGSVTIIR